MYLAAAWFLVLAAIVGFWRWPSVGTMALALVLISARQQALLNVEHECSHGTFVRKKVWNDRIGAWLSAAPVGSPYSTSRAQHLAHHRLVGTRDDPDLRLHAGPDKQTTFGVLKHFGLGLTGGYAALVLFSRAETVVDARVRSLDRLRLLAVQAVLLAAITLLTAWWVYPVLWLLPLATLTAGSHLLRSFGEHAITAAEKDLHGNRLISITSNRLERFLVAPFNMNFHSEHHLFPWVPARQLPEVQRRLDQVAISGPARLRRGSYLSALRLYTASLV
jgi:fatty acid desaturase